jgi:hypothetical protein
MITQNNERLIVSTTAVSIYFIRRVEAKVQNSEVNTAYNVIIIQKAYTKLNARQHGLPTGGNLGSGVTGTEE